MSTIANPTQTNRTNPSVTASNLRVTSLAIDDAGRFAIRYGLVAVIAYIGLMKFTSYEAEAISGLISNSPFLAWTYNLFSTQSLANFIGASELLIAGLIAIRPWSPKASAIGSLMAVGMFLTTLSFMFTTPGVFEPSLSFPALSVMPGQFLVKDIALLGIAFWTLGDSYRALKRNS